MRSQGLVVGACFGMMSVSVGFAEEIVLRNGGFIEAPVVAVGVDGLSLGGDAPRVLGWDLVYFVRGDSATAAAAFHEFSEDVWRARLRLERGDFELASRLFEPLFERLLAEGIGGPTGLVIAEGALRCRVAAGRHGDAIVAWAAALRIRETGQRMSGESGGGGVIDVPTRLVPSLPPFWLDGSPDARRFMELDLGSIGVDGAGTDTLIGLYRAAADRDLSGGIFSPDPDRSVDLGGAGEDGGALLLRQLLLASSDDAVARQRAREVLERLVAEQVGGWKEAWARFAIGRSLLRETEPALRDAGMLQLLHLPARFSRSQHHLAAIALAEVGRELHLRGDADALAAIRRELASGYRGHDAVEWLEQEIGN